MITVVLTGGRAAEQIYRHWASDARFKRLQCIRWVLGDERCVPSDHPVSNHRMVLESLFPEGVPLSHRFEPLFPRSKVVDAPRIDDPVLSVDVAERAAACLSSMVSVTVDCLFLSVGEDGHVASLFPDAPAVHEQARRVVVVDHAPKYPPRRVTITRSVISQARRVVVFAHGPAKAGLHAKARQASDVASCPARLALDGRWLCGDDLQAMASDALCELLSVVNQ